ncbi:hypothetical protein AAE021_00145 [Arthrobacter citreus]|uniref:Uncharacterized protein n=1 Tax=Arthrobacter citreus TaxID=1670 RepID=A0ABZ2ZV26_9MICC
MGKYTDTFVRFVEQASDAVAFEDKRLVPDEVNAERFRRLREAEKQLLEFLPSETAAKSSDAAREAALNQLRPLDADSVAVANNEWAKVQQLEAAGRSLEVLIRGGDQFRLAAILDKYPTVLEASRKDASDIVAEIQERVLTRLAELDDSNAVKYSEAKQSAMTDAAWRRVMLEATSGEGVSSYEARAGVSLADPVGYRRSAPAFDELARLQRAIRAVRDFARFQVVE